MSIKKDLKKFFNWVWNSESFLSYIVLILLIIIIVKLILFPLLNLIFQTSLPLAIVESSSMDHRIIPEQGTYSLCGQTFDKKSKTDFDQYWEVCGGWYEQNTNLTKDQFQNFKFSNGFHKSDLMIISGSKEIEIGDVIVFSSYTHRHPIIHRVISLNPIQTKGDHNEVQLPIEENINNNQVIGIAIGKIPYIGWPKVALYEQWQKNPIRVILISIVILLLLIYFPDIKKIIVKTFKNNKE